jgi:NAD(P)-dependent dehydrogenase (short-subunit alcohol dehydrogenase family)
MEPNDLVFPDTVLVTGAAGAIGSALCRVLLGRGVKVIGTDREASPSGDEKKLVWVPADLENADDRARIVRAVRERSRGSLGIVHNASFVGDSELEGWVGPFESQSTKTWNRALDVSLTAAFEMTRELSSTLKENPGSSIVHVSSIYASVGPDWSLYSDTSMGNPVAYGVAKAGLEQLTRWLATDLAPNARVNAVSPGGLLRKQHQAFVDRYVSKVPLGRMASEADVVGSVLFLLSNQSAYITGQVITVDGGYTIT